MHLLIPCHFAHKTCGAKVKGLIRTAVAQDFLLWASWRYRAEDEDRNWEWWEFYRQCKRSKGTQECYAAFARRELHGLMMTTCRQRGSSGYVFVDYLATNPINREAGSGLKHIGVSLIATAVLRSLEIGAEGVLRLESLAGAESFYENLGFSKQKAKSPEGYSTYVLKKSAAKELLEEIKKKGILKL